MNKRYFKYLAGFFAFSLSVSSIANPKVDLFDTCTHSISALEIQIESELAISQAQVNAGLVSGEDHRNLQTTLAAIKQQLSLENCMTSGAGDLGVYQCLAENNGNHGKCFPAK